MFDHDIIKIGRAVKFKWYLMVNIKDIDLVWISCEYCHYFSHISDDDETPSCSGCPIKHFTKMRGCIATPYFTFRRVKCRANAKKMKQLVDEIFIRSLLFIDWRKYYAVSKL